MKRIIYNKCTLILLFAWLIFLTGCKQEEGYYETPNINSGTHLDTYDYLKSKTGIYDSLLFIIDKMGIEKTLRDSNITLFAPSNLSFQIALKNLNDIRRIQGKESVFLKDLVKGTTLIKADIIKTKADSIHLDTLVSQYIIKGQFYTEDLKVGDGQTFFSVRGDYPMHGQRIFADSQGWQKGGSELIEFATTKRSIFVPNWVKTTTRSVNIKTKNGIVHLLDPEHVFGFDEFVRRLTLVPPPTNLFKLPGNSWNIVFQDPNEFDGKVNQGEKFAKVLDGSLLTKIYCNFNASTNKITMNWIPANPVVSNCYTLASANDSKKNSLRDPKAWRIEGSHDNIKWTILDTRQDIKFETNYQVKLFHFKNDVAYKYYKIYFLQNGGDKLFQISEWTMNYKEEVK